MFGKQSKRQTGFALLIFLVIMMGLGGIALTGFSQKVIKAVEKNRFEHNKDVLLQAKNALLMFAYNYPVTHSGQGPGRLPCPYNQIPIGAGSGYSGSISNAICEAVGRLPWGHTNLELPEFKDADGEHLWYAVSKDFNNNAFRVINSDTKGTISIKDQTGNIIYDGAVAGIAAVIIAPGSAIKIDDDDNGSPNYQQVRNRNNPADTDNSDPKNFLDSAFSESNSSFTNSAPNGFISGPIISSNNELLINDQIIIISAEEVIEMAEKATLDAYRTAVNDYLTNTGGVYPWLYNYNVSPACVDETPPGSGTNEALCIAKGGDWSIIELSSKYAAHNNFNDEKANELDNFGRIPSMFAPYFSEVNSESIESKISLGYNNVTYLGAITYNQTSPIVASDTYTFADVIWNGDPAPVGDHSGTFQSVEPVIDLRFEDDGATNIAKLVGSIAINEMVSQPTIYFWNKGGGSWAKCEDDAQQVTDCHVDSGYQPDPGGTGQQPIEVLKVDFTLTFDNTPDAVEFRFDVSNLTGPPTNPSITPADENGHAQITATLSSSEITIPTSMLEISYEYDSVYTDSDWNVEASGTLDFSSFAGVTVDLGLRYYPEIPVWAFDNNWHDSVMMAYAIDYEPDPISSPPCSEGTDYLQIDGLAGNNDNKISILTLAGERSWVDGDISPFVAPDGLFTDELGDVFNSENSDLDNIFDMRTIENTGAPGDRKRDKILVIEEC